MSKRDLRIDFFRGLALVIIYIDHIPFDGLSRLTIRNLGFSSAADTFILLSGIAVVLAYGSRIDRGGVSAAVPPIFRRISTIYFAHIVVLTLALTLLLVVGKDAWLDNFTIAPVPLWGGQTIPNAIARALTLQFQPSYFDILPLYVILLLLAVPFLLLARVHWSVAMAASITLFVAASVFEVNLPGTRSGFGWYFNPLTWQIVFVAGICIGIANQSRTEFKGDPLVTTLCLAYLAFAFVVVAPCRHTQLAGYCHLDHLAFLDPLEDRQTPLRFLNTLAWVYLIALFIPRDAQWLKSRASRMLTRMGQHSLAVFSVGSLLSLVGRLFFADYGSLLSVEIALNVVGIAILALTGLILDRSRLELTPGSSTLHALHSMRLAHARGPKRIR